VALELSDADVGLAPARPGELSDAEVFGPPPRQVGVGEAFSRGASGFYNRAREAFAAPFVGAAEVIARGQEAIAGNKPEYAETVDRLLGASYFRRGAEAAALQPGEAPSGVVSEALIGGAPEVGRMVPEMALGIGSASRYPVVKGAELVGDLVRGYYAGTATGARMAEEKQRQLLEAGASPTEAALGGTATGVMTQGQFALPAATPAKALTLPRRIAERAVTGGTIAAGTQPAQTQAENVIASEYPDLQRDPFDPAALLTTAAMGAGMGQMAGRAPSPLPRRADLGYPARAENIWEQGASDGATDWQPPPPPDAAPSLDPRAQVQAVQEAIYGVPSDAPAPPEGMALVSRKAPTLPGMQPDVSDVPVRVAPDWETEGAPRPTPREPGLDALGREIPLDAEAAFRVAEAQQQRKQAGQDDAALQGEPRDLSEARAGGTTTPEGTAALKQESFAFLDVQRGRDGRVRSTGPQVEILGEVAMKDAKGNDVPGYRVSYEADGPNGPERVFEVVPQSRVGTLERPASPRFAQDVADTTYSPPRGVGTESPPQPAPRRAGQRISTEASPEFIPADRAAPASEPPAARQGRTFTQPQERLPGPRADVPEEPPWMAQPEPPRAAPEPEPAPRKGRERMSGPVLGRVRQAGGIDPKESMEIFGEPANVMNQRFPGLFRKGGRTADGLREWMQQEGILREHDIENAERNLPGGAAELAYQRLRAEMEGKSANKAAAWERERAAAWREHEERLANDPEYRAEQERIQAEAARAEQVEADRLLELSERAEAANPEAFEDAAMRFADDDAGFERELRRIIDDAEQRPEAEGEPRAEAGEVRAEGERGEVRAEERPDFELEPTSEAGLRAKAAADERAAAEQRRVDEAPPPEDFVLSGSDRPADVGAARGQTDAFGNSGRLYGGMPVDEMLRFLLDRTQAITGPWKEWGQAALKMQEGAQAIAEAFGAKIDAIKGGERQAPGGESLPGAIFRAVTYNVHSHIKSFGEAWNSPTVGRIADMIYSTAGKAQEGQSYHEAIGAHVTERQTSLSGLARDIDALAKSSKISDAQIIKMVENPSARQGKAGEIAARIADWLKAEHAYMKAAGVDIGNVTNYFPRVYDRARIIMQRASFEADAKRAYEKMGLSGDEALKAARAFWFREAYGSDGSPAWHAEHGTEKITRARELTPEAAEQLRAWRTDSIIDTLTGYLNASAKRAEIARRFGDKWSGWDALEKQVIKEAPGIDTEQIKEFRAMVANAMGLRASTMGAAAHTSTQYLRMWTALATMPKAMLSSVAETWMPLVRANGDMAVAVHHLRNVLYENGKNLLSQALGAGRTQNVQRLFDFAEDVGALSQSPLSHLMADRWMGGDVASKRVKAITSKFFRLNLLEQVTTWQRAIAVDAARIFMRRQAKMVANGEKGAAFYLRELGVPEGKVNDFAAFVRSLGDDLPEADMLQGENGAMYRNALVRFADQAIQRPTAATRPAWANTEWGAVVFQLQGFANAFHKNVLLRQANLAKEAMTGDGYGKAERLAMMGGMIPGLMLSAATAGLVWELRDKIPELAGGKARERTDQAKVERAISAAGLTGALDPWLNMVGGIRYQRSPMAQAAGPGLGAVEQAYSSMVSLWLQNSDRTNTAERRAWDTFYQWGLEPAATMLIAATPAPVSPATQALTVLALPAAKSAFVDAAAGPKDRRREKPIRGILEPKK